MHGQQNKNCACEYIEYTDIHIYMYVIYMYIEADNKHVLVLSLGISVVYYNNIRRGKNWSKTQL
jgi:hypothetical protein